MDQTAPHRPIHQAHTYRILINYRFSVMNIARLLSLLNGCFTLNCLNCSIQYLLCQPLFRWAYGTKSAEILPESPGRQKIYPLKFALIPFIKLSYRPEYHSYENLINFLDGRLVSHAHRTWLPHQSALYKANPQNLPLKVSGVNTAYSLLYKTFRCLPQACLSSLRPYHRWWRLRLFLLYEF